MNTSDAIKKANDSGNDLVIISIASKPPVAKILNYGKFKYERNKKKKAAKVKQTIIKNREVRLTPMIGIADLEVKVKKARSFLEDGDRVKISLKFRGREMLRKELGFNTMDLFFSKINDIAQIQVPKKMNGRFLDMYVVKGKNTKKQAPNNNEQVKEVENGKNKNKIITKKKN